MPSFVNRLFNIRTPEWPRLLWLFLMAFITVVGVTWGKLTVQPLFWQAAGVQNLGYTFVLEGLLAIGVVIIYSPFADRLAHDRLLIAIALLSATAVSSGWLLLNLGHDKTAVFLLYPLFTIIPFIINLQWWTYVTSFYDTRAAKRIVPVLASNARLAGAFAGLTVSRVTLWAGSSATVIALWAGSLLLLAGLIWLLPHVLQAQDDTAVAPIIPADNYLKSLREGYQYVANSAYLRWLALATLLVTLILTLLKYQSSQLIDQAFQAGTLLTQRYSSPTAFLGQVEGYTNLLMLPVQIFILSRLIGKIGLSRANLIFPTGTTAVLLGLLLSPTLAIGTLAYLTANIFNTAFRNPIDNLLFNAIPLRMKGRARMFVTGILVQVGLLLGGLLLLLPWLRTVDWLLPGLLLLFGVLYFLASLRVSQQYTNALVLMLEQEDYSFLLGREADDLTVTDPAMMVWLQDKLDRSQNDELTLFMATLISSVGGKQAVPILAALAWRSDVHIRAATLDILAVSDVGGTAVRDLYMVFLQDPAPAVRRSALAGLERVDGRNNPHFLAVAATLLNDDDVEVRAQTLPALLRYGDLVQREQALSSIKMMLDHSSNLERAYALYALGQTADTGYVPNVAAMLRDEADLVRLEASIILENFAKNQGTAEPLQPEVAAEVVAAMLPLLHDPVERIRQAALVTIVHIGREQEHGRLLVSLNDPSPQIRKTAVDLLAGLGRTITPLVLPLVDSPDRQMQKMAAVILGRVNRREYGSLINRQIQASLLQIAENLSYLEALQPLHHYASVTILQSEFREANDRLLDEVFFLLTAVQDAESVAVIRESLASDVERIQANAQEALESLTSSQTAEMIALVVNLQQATAEFMQMSQETWDLKLPTTVEAVEKLTIDASTDPWPRSIAIYALGEVGYAMIQPQTAVSATPAEPISTSAEPEMGHGRRRRQATDLLDQLIETDAAPSASDEGMEGPTKAAERPTEAGEGPSEAAERPSEAAEGPSKRRQRAARASNLLDDLAGEAKTEAKEEASTPESPNMTALKTLYYPPPSIAKTFTITRLFTLLNQASFAPEEGVRVAARRASDMIAGKELLSQSKEGAVLSAIERIIFLKEVLFFKDMTVDQLKVLATVCEECFYKEDEAIYKEGDAGGVLHVVVRGRVSIEREARRGSVARLATIEAYAYFGEMNLFDASPHTDTAVALQDTITLNLRREPLIALARQYPDLSLKLINILSQRLRETTDQVARLTKSHPRALHKVFDQLE